LEKQDLHIYCPFVEHHCIVLGYLTLELTVMLIGNTVANGQDTIQAAPKAQLYTGKIDELTYKRKVTTTLKS